jgi:hypothetical protein
MRQPLFCLLRLRRKGFCFPEDELPLKQVPWGTKPKPDRNMAAGTEEKKIDVQYPQRDL